MKKQYLLGVMAAVMTMFGGNGGLGGGQVFGMNLAQNRGDNAQEQVPNLTDLPDRIQTAFSEALSIADSVDRNIYGVLAGLTHGALAIFHYLTLNRTHSQVMRDGRNAIAFLAHSLGIDLFNGRKFRIITAQDNVTENAVLQVLNRMVSYTLREAYYQLGGRIDIGSGNDFNGGLNLLAGFVDFDNLGSLQSGEAIAATHHLPLETVALQNRLRWVADHMQGRRIQVQTEDDGNTGNGNAAITGDGELQRDPAQTENDFEGIEEEEEDRSDDEVVAVQQPQNQQPQPDAQRPLARNAAEVTGDSDSEFNDSIFEFGSEIEEEEEDVE